MERRIPVAFFQPPNFERKEYLTEAVRIVKEVIRATRADETTRFKVCSGYILSAVRTFLQEQGFLVEVVEVTGELQRRVEQGYINWCIEVGVPPQILSREGGRNRFWALLNWVGENPSMRESLVKTGWKKWSYWRARITRRAR